MRKVLKRIGICLLAAATVWCGSVICDRGRLREELVRLHVVGASDSEADQALKLRVRDAVTESLWAEMKNFRNPEEAERYLQENLPKLKELANRVLREAGCADTARVTLEVEEFSQRVYETFRLPAGLYRSLRITIGAGEGKNWWCVVYPSLCLPVTAEGFEDAAQCAGFPEVMTATLEGKEGYEVRFLFLELLGRLENMLHRG